MILGLLSLLRGWQVVDRFLTRIAGHFTTWPADDFARFTTTPIGLTLAEPLQGARPPSPIPVRPPAPLSIAPGAFEMRFTRFQREGQYEQMWSMLAEDAQRSWGSEDRFIEQMRRQDGAAQLVEAEVGSVDIVPEWTDRHRNRTYRNVARLAVRYRFKDEWRDVTVDRQVHLVPAADGWRTLCYPQAG
ncbi:MAG: hypothetical protein NVS9B1_18590 [Candidatus Dormibacteraceae bacterium]